MINKYFFVAGLFILFLFNQCNGCKETKIECEEGYEPLGEQCTCPEGKHESFGVCRALEPGELYSNTSGCYCNNGMFFKVILKIGDAGNRQVWIRTIDVGGIPSTTSLNCIEKPDGDSIFGEWSSSCRIDGKSYAQMVNGKFLSPNHLRLKMRYVRDTSDAEREFEIVKDSCIIDLEHK